MSRKYKFRDQSKLYFITLTTVKWIDVFTREQYKSEIISSWNYCIENKGLEIYAWCIMTNHIHMIIGTNKNSLESILRDMKSYTSHKIKSLLLLPTESRKWMYSVFAEQGQKNGNNSNFQFWQQHNQPVVLDNPKLMDEKMNYIHMNPVVAGYVDEPEFWIYSSARDYAGMNGKVKVCFID